MQNQFNQQQLNQQNIGIGAGQQPNYLNNSFGGFLPDQYQNMYYNPYGNYPPVGGAFAGSGGLAVSPASNNLPQNSYLVSSSYDTRIIFIIFKDKYNNNNYSKIKIKIKALIKMLILNINKCF